MESHNEARLVEALERIANSLEALTKCIDDPYVKGRAEIRVRDQGR